MFKVYRNVFVVIFLGGCGLCFNLKKSYTAAVVDYLHIYKNYAQELLTANVEEYVKLIRNASKQNAQIIVFPEYGLVDIYKLYNVTEHDKNRLEEYSIFIPDPELGITPCKDEYSNNYSMPLVNISYEALIHNMYIVINIPEKVLNNETRKLDYYNTNVVFDNYGTIIARYRKINLSIEPFFKAGQDIVTFNTDFGVTFGIFTCFDILFQYPARDILSTTNITDIIFPTAWFSETPFLQALSIQHGYVKANGVNFLAAGLQEPGNSDGGSAIFLADGTIAEAFITNKRTTKIIIQEIPIIESRKDSSTCLNNRIKQSSPKDFIDVAHSNDIDNFPLKRENISGYTFEPLNTVAWTFRNICNEEMNLCCIFNITVDLDKSSHLDYTYMMAVYNGLSFYSTDYLGGVSICALLACLNESDTNSCGYRTTTDMKAVQLKSIEIETVLAKSNITYYQPSTLRNDLMPISEYEFCEREVAESQVQILLTTTEPPDSVITFGIYGRIYSEDQIVTPAPPPQIQPLNYSLILIIVSFSVVLIICTAGLLYNYCMQEE